MEYVYEKPEIPVVDAGMEGPMRCPRCKAYVNPNTQFFEMGAKTVCNICSMSSPVPQHYVCQLDQYGQRMDKNDRPELRYGTYEFLVRDNYMKEYVPCLPKHVFLIDVSTPS